MKRADVIRELQHIGPFSAWECPRTTGHRRCELFRMLGIVHAPRAFRVVQFWREHPPFEQSGRVVWNVPDDPASAE